MSDERPTSPNQVGDFAERPAGPVPMRDPALGVEVGFDVQRALMTREDWEEMVDRFLDTPVIGGPTDG